jgi:hypothetical protein
MLKLPTKYSDFKQITHVTKENIEWLVKHFVVINGKGTNSEREKLARLVFNSIKK